MTVEQYLEIDRATQERIEYYNGEISEVPGATWTHSLLTTSMMVSIHTATTRECRVLPHMRVEVTKGLAYIYPDIACSANNRN